MKRTAKWWENLPAARDLRCPLSPVRAGPSASRGSLIPSAVRTGVFAVGAIVSAPCVCAQGTIVLRPLSSGDILQFGAPVAAAPDLDGDGWPDLLVGARYDRDPSNFDIQGAVYVFSGHSGSLLRVTRAPSPATNGPTGFGESAAGCGDLNLDERGEYIAGAYVEGLGRAYLFSGSDGTLLRATDPPGDYGPFGLPVLGIHDLDGDGIDDILVAATFSFGGRVFAFSGASGALIRTFAPPASPRHDDFGKALCEVPDVDHDGAPELAIGATYWNGYWQGIVYLFSGRTGEVLWSQSPATPTTFGTSIAALRNIDAKGACALAVGAPGDRKPGTESFRPGFVYILGAADGSIVRIVGSPSPQNAGQFGIQVAGLDDMDADLRGDLLVGAFGEAGPGLEHGGGRAYVVSSADGHLIRALASPMPFHYGNFGAFVAATGDLDGDGKSDWVVGAPGDCDVCFPNTPGEGHAYIFFSCRADWNMSATVDSQDFFDFLSDWFDSRADFNVDGVCDTRDFFDFLVEFFNGCR